MSRRRETPRRGWGTGLLVGPVLAGLLLCAVRVECTRLSLRKGETVRQGQRLLERKEQLILARGRLRDPLQLARDARALGFGPPDRVIELPAPSRRGSSR